MNILITGGASGLGKAITLKCAQKFQGTIHITYCRSQTAAQEIEQQYPSVRASFCDFTDKTSVQQLCSRMEQMELDVLINNAITGLTLKQSHKLDISSLHNSFVCDVLPSVEISMKAIAIFRKKNFGKIITILTSVLSDGPALGFAEYAANKSYLASLCRFWAAENARFNISCNTVSPSLMKTALTKHLDERMLEDMCDRTPQQKLVSVEEVADAVSYLVDCSQYINGINLLINGGTGAV